MCILTDTESTKENLKKQNEESDKQSRDREVIHHVITRRTPPRTFTGKKSPTDKTEERKRKRDIKEGGR